jgi:hypothetical protein
MASTATLAQDALNISVNLQNRIHQGQYGVDIYAAIQDLCAAVNLLAEVVSSNASTLSATTTPTSIAISNKYNAANVSTTSPIYTSP